MTTPVSPLVTNKLSTTSNAFVRRIADLIDTSEKTQRQIALELGYDKPNLVTMFKQGVTRLPIDKVPAFALSLDVDAASLLRLWLATYEPETLAVIDQALGTFLTVNELEWLRGIRQAFAEDVPPFDEGARRQIGLLAEMSLTGGGIPKDEAPA